ncbi:MAG: AAA family ATPase [Pseudomonadota bacterium]
MHVICLLSLKGGAGKSTVAQSIAVCASDHGQNTLIIELDPQGTLKNWSKRRQAEHPRVVQTLPQSLGEVLEEARAAGVHWVFIDTPGQQSTASNAAAAAADLILIPCKVQSTKDLDAAVFSINDAKRSGKRAYVLLTQVPPKGTRLVRHRQLSIQREHGITVLSRYLSRRAAFEYCDAHGLSAAEFRPDSQAAEETERLYCLLQSIFIRADLGAALKPSPAVPAQPPGLTGVCESRPNASQAAPASLIEPGSRALSAPAVLDRFGMAELSGLSELPD